MSSVKTLTEYIEKVRSVSKLLGLETTTINPWFRGVKDIGFKLEPGLYRDERLQKCEREINRDFKLKSGPFLESNEPKSEIEWLFVMQHYGLPTRLLDWTESYLTALFFAVYEHTYNEDAYVAVLNPWELNTEHLLTKSIVDPDNDIIADYIIDNERKIKGDFPIAIRTNRNSKRILAQKGVFTIHGNCDDPLEDYNIDIDIIKIDKNSKLGILKDLYQAGVTESTIFPELTGISNEIKFSYTEFMSEDLTTWRNPKNFSKTTISF